MSQPRHLLGSLRQFVTCSSCVCSNLSQARPLLLVCSPLCLYVVFVHVSTCVPLHLFSLCVVVVHLSLPDMRPASPVSLYPKGITISRPVPYLERSGPYLYKYPLHLLLIWFCVSAYLNVSNHSHYLSVLLDSGSAGKFTFQSLVASLSILVVKLASLISVNALDSRPLSDRPITHLSLPLCIELSLQHT